jgi:hypothetical protein
MIVNAHGEVPVYFVATKIDNLGSLLDQKEEAEAIMTERTAAAKNFENLGRLYFECSALSKDGLKIAMDSIIIMVVDSLP